MEWTEPDVILQMEIQLNAAQSPSQTKNLTEKKKSNIQTGVSVFYLPVKKEYWISSDFREWFNKVAFAQMEQMKKDKTMTKESTSLCLESSVSCPPNIYNVIVCSLMLL